MLGIAGFQFNWPTQSVGVVNRLGSLLVLGMAVGCGSATDERSVSAADVPKAPAIASAEPGQVGEPDANGFLSTPSGLKYKIVREGSGPKPKKSDRVKVHYKGWLDSGKVFDSSYDRKEPIEFPLSGVIPGWTEGMQLVGEGGEIELDIPSELGYGRRGSPPVIPANAQLHFKVELLKVNP